MPILLSSANGWRRYIDWLRVSVFVTTRFRSNPILTTFVSVLFAVTKLPYYFIGSTSFSSNIFSKRKCGTIVTGNIVFVETILVLQKN